MLKNIKYLILALVFTSCAVGPNYSPPELKSFHILQEKNLLSKNTQEHRWWKNFKDPILNALIIKAEKNNLDINTAYLNIKKSQLIYKIVKEDFEPNAALIIDPKRGKKSENVPSFGPGLTGNNLNLGLSVSWEVDLFGRINRLVEAKNAKYQADRFLYQDVLLSLKAQVASTYIQIRSLEDKIRITKKNIKIQEDFFNLTTKLKNAGSASKLDVIRANSNLLSTQAYLPSIYANKTALVQQLSVLLNTKAVELQKSIQSAKSFIPITKKENIIFTANLLRNRPDVRLKERELAAQTALIGVATTALYPSLSLSGFLGYNSISSSNLLSPESLLWNVGGSFFYSIFNRGKIKNSIKIEETKALMALNAYKKTVLSAIAEVNSNLDFYKSEKIKFTYLKKAYVLSEESVHLANLRYENGLSSFQEVLASQKQLFLSEESLSQSKTSSSLYYIKLHKALGLGWNTQKDKKEKVK